MTRWGSKYETLIVPIVTVMLGYFFRGIAKVAAKHEENGNNNENVCIVAGIVTLIIFNAMTGYVRIPLDWNSQSAIAVRLSTPNGTFYQLTWVTHVLAIQFKAERLVYEAVQTCIRISIISKQVIP